MNPNDGTSTNGPGGCSATGRSLLALTKVPGLGPVRIARLIGSMGSLEAVLGASVSQLSRVQGIGESTAAQIAKHLHGALESVDDELERIASFGAHVVAMGDPGYPEMLAATPSPPPILCVRGALEPEGRHRYPCAIVGSRACSVYGIEQAEHFASTLGGAGITIVSGGARGIDTAAHRGALTSGGPTIVVLGCGIGHCYPPENAGLFDEVVEQGGAVVSELPCMTRPDAKNFPARNRIISGLSLGVLVIEAGTRSGALITARHACEEHGREVMGLPGRVDSPSSAGTLELLRNGAHLVCEPGDVLKILEHDAFHLFRGTHTPKTQDPSRTTERATAGTNPPVPAPPVPPLPDPDGDMGRVLTALAEPRTGDALSEDLSIEPGALRSMLTMLEIQGLVRRSGSRFERVR